MFEVKQRASEWSDGMANEIRFYLYLLGIVVTANRKRRAWGFESAHVVNGLGLFSQGVSYKKTSVYKKQIWNHVLYCHELRSSNIHFETQYSFIE